MDDLHRWFAQGLTGHLFALESARLAVERGHAAALPAVRRIAESLRAAGTRDGHPDLAVTAALVLGASDEELPAQLDVCLGAIRAALAESDGEPLDLLIVDDDPITCRYLEATLTMPNRRFHRAATMAEAQRHMDERRPALVVLDLSLPDADGRTLLMSIRSRPSWAAVPVIVLTASGGSQARTECFALGADEVIGKPFDPTSLAVCVAAKLHRAAELTRWSRTDELTGLANRSALEQAFERVKTATLAMDMPFSLALIDAAGPGAGAPAANEEDLKAVGAALGHKLRTGDIVGRWSGSMFVALLPNARAEGGRRAIEHALARPGAAAGPEAAAPPVAFAVVEAGASARLEDVLLRAYRELVRVRRAGADGQGAGARESDGHRRALVVEDDPVTAAVIGGMLKLNGYRVEVVGDGKGAIRTATDRPAQLIVLDVGLPGVDGFEVLRRVRNGSACRRTPVVMVSGVRDSRSIARGLGLGADDYVVKPFSPVELLARIDRLEPRSACARR